MSRKPWPAYFLDVAEMIATRSTCPRLHVGAVLVLNNRIVASGYNGSHPGESHCEDIGCKVQACPVHTSHCTRTVHAEMNVLFQLDREPGRNLPLEKMVLYLTHEPCRRCRMLLWQRGIRRFEWRHPYRSDYGVGDCSLVT